MTAELRDLLTWDTRDDEGIATRGTIHSECAEVINDTTMGTMGKAMVRAISAEIDGMPFVHQSVVFASQYHFP